METKHREFLDSMISRIKSHDDWLTIVKFGLPTLLEDQDVLIELVINEGRRMVTQDEFGGGRGQHVNELDSAAVRQILQELKLRLVVG